MTTKIKYNVSGIGEVEVEVDSSAIQDKKGREEYKNLHRFLTGVLSDAPAKEDETQEGQSSDASRSHNKSQPHFKADRRLAKIIIDKGGLKFLHGVNIINKKQVFFFDRVPMVQDIIERYNMQADMIPSGGRQGAPAKKNVTKSNKKRPQKDSEVKQKEQTASVPVKGAALEQPAVPNKTETSVPPDVATIESSAAAGGDVT